MAEIPGIILAGGRATRMGGGDKGLKLVGGRRLIDHVIARLAPQCGPLALNANGDPARFIDLGLPVLPDSLPDHPGPLAGVLAGLDWACEQGGEAIVTAAADTPFFPTDLVARLRAAAGPACGWSSQTRSMVSNSLARSASSSDVGPPSSTTTTSRRPSGKSEAANDSRQRAIFSGRR